MDDASVGSKGEGKRLVDEYFEREIASLPEGLRDDARKLIELRDRAIRVICRRNQRANMLAELRKRTQTLDDSRILESDLEELEQAVNALNGQVELLKAEVTQAEISLYDRRRESRLKGIPAAHLEQANGLLREEQESIQAAAYQAAPSMAAAGKATRYYSGVEGAWRLAIAAGDQALAETQLIRLEAARVEMATAAAGRDEHTLHMESIRADFAARLEALKET